MNMKGNYLDSEDLGPECSSKGNQATGLQKNIDFDVNTLETYNIPSKCNQINEEVSSAVRSKRRFQVFSDSEGESNNDIVNKAKNDPNDKSNQYDSDSSNDMHVSSLQKSRLRKMSTSEDDSTSEAIDDLVSRNEHESRIQNKRDKLRQKFKSLVSKKNKKAMTECENKQDDITVEDNFDEFHSSDDEISSIDKIRQENKDRMEHLKSSIYDPDTSDEESSMDTKKIAVQKKGRKSTKPISPKPLRMSAKQAMENMQKIKSESNRMLREKEVSLPYHRPKALSLKDIMSRRRAAITADGKVLPIKMNEEQLKQYAQILEQRQKEVIELCKSDTEEEEEAEQTENKTEEKSEVASQNDTLYDNIPKTEDQVRNTGDDNVSIVSKNEDNAHYDSNDSRKPLNNDSDNTDKINECDSKLHGESDDIIMSVDSVCRDTSNTVDENNSMEMELVYNDSVEETSVIDKTKNVIEDLNNMDVIDKNIKPSTEVDSQLISLHFDTERTENSEKNKQSDINYKEIAEDHNDNKTNHSLAEENSTEVKQNINFSDDEDMNIEDIDALIENAEITATQTVPGSLNSPMLIKEPLPLTGKPKLTGAPGMVIDLDGSDPFVPRKLTGVELLKERFVYFAKLKTPEELEREKEKRIKPGMQHLKLKQELEHQIAEQRSLEWAKRLEEGKFVKENDLEDEEDIDEIEAKLEQKEDALGNESSSESEEEAEEELEQEIVDKPRKRNPMVDDEAEESDCDEVEDEERMDDNKDHEENNADDEADESEEESSEESQESEDEQQEKPRLGRILKAFEDSDDEGTSTAEEQTGTISKTTNEHDDAKIVASSQVVKTTQDDELHLAQKSFSEDLFTSQDSHVTNSGKTQLTDKKMDNSFEEKELGTQTFSILETTTKEILGVDLPMPDTLSISRDTQSHDDNLDAVVGMCSGSFSQTQNLVPQSQTSAGVGVSQCIGDDVLALCTGQFYDNQFISQVDDDNTKNYLSNNVDTDTIPKTIEENKLTTLDYSQDENETKEPEAIVRHSYNKNGAITLEDPNLKSILDELDGPEFDAPKPNKYFLRDDNNDKENKQIVANAQFKKKLIIDSDEEGIQEDTSDKKKKKIKRKKLEQRALQISDEEDELEEAEEYESDLEENETDKEERIVEYDSEENEIIVEPQKPKKKRKLGEFFEQEAELTSEDEWIGSGDEDEAGLDRMEREAGDDDTFNQTQLQRELGQIHMRDVLDQDKREVRLIQELLFEDGDLGGGSRQRKFRWRNVDGEEETGTAYDEFVDTQEEEFESEEQWRKQRHEREMFLKSLKNQEEPEESLNISMNRTTMIKANLSKNTSNLFVEFEQTEEPAPEKKTATAKDIPSPKKPFVILKQNYHGSLLTRGRGALARLAALATPLAQDDDAPKVGSLAPSSKRNFVFASVDAPQPEQVEPKVAKRKADSNTGTPRLVKKMRTEEKQKYPKSSLLDHLKV